MRALSRSVKNGRLQAQGFLAHRRGLAAVEFALILPMMLLIYLGLVELAHGLRAAQQVDLIAHTLADLAGQQGNSQPSSQATLADADFQSIFGAGYALLAPLSTSTLKMTISEINILENTSTNPATYYATVDWTVANNGGVRRNGSGCLTGYTTTAQFNPPKSWPASSTTMPAAFTTGSSQPAGPVIVADVTYAYSLGFASSVTTNFSLPNPQITIQRTVYAPVRNQYSNTTYPNLYNHIAYAVTGSPAPTAPVTTLVGTNCISPIP